MRVNLRKEARGRPCMYRAPGCDGGGETTVLAHIRRCGIAGTGLKGPDVVAFWCCAPCHDLFDGRRSATEWSREQLDLMAFDALIRTLAKLYDEELI